MPRSKAIHALYECCGHVILASKLADARPFLSHDQLVGQIDDEYLLLSTFDQTVAFAPPAINDRLLEMLGPADGWPEYMP